MTALTTLGLLAFFLANPLPSSLDQVKAEPNLEKRARLAMDYAGVAQREAETAYGNGDLENTVSRLKTVLESVELAKATLDSSGRTPGRNPAVYKYAEQKSTELLLRLRDLDQRMGDEERESVKPIRTKVQEIHDEWFEGIMERKK